MLSENTIKSISEKTGASKEQIVSIVEDWATPLMRRGIIVKLSIKRWRATQKIEHSDTGLNSEDSEWRRFSSQYLKLGKKVLLPFHALSSLNRIESRSRSNLKECSYDTVWGRFVPYNSYAEWRVRNEQIRDDYFLAADEMVKRYPELIEEVLDEYRQHAKTLFYSVEKREGPYEEFEKQYIDEIRSSIISAEQFRASFEYDLFFSFIPIPSEVQKNLLEAESLESEREEIGKEREIRKIVIEETAELKTKCIEQFLESTVGEIRGTVVRVIEEVKSGLDRGNDSPTIGKSRTKLLKMIKRIRMLDFYDDSEIQNLLARLENDLEKDKEDRSEDEVIKTLKELEFSAKKNVQNLIGEGRFSMVELD